MFEINTYYIFGRTFSLFSLYNNIIFISYSVLDEFLLGYEVFIKQCHLAYQTHSGGWGDQGHSDLGGHARRKRRPRWPRPAETPASVATPGVDGSLGGHARQNRRKRQPLAAILYKKSNWHRHCVTSIYKRIRTKIIINIAFALS